MAGKKGKKLQIKKENDRKKIDAKILGFKKWQKRQFIKKAENKRKNLKLKNGGNIQVKKN